MTCYLTKCLLLTTAWLAVSATSALGAEIRLRARCEHSGGIVLLGDIAEIQAMTPRDAARLAMLELIPAPAAGESQYLGIQRIQETLLRRGVNLARCQFTGSSQVEIVRLDGRTLDRGLEPVQISESQHGRAEQFVHQALASSIESRHEGAMPYELSFRLNDQQAQTVLNHRGQLTVKAPARLTPGVHMFEIHPASETAAEDFTLQVQVTTQPMVVVSTSPLSRGAVIREGDVQLVPGGEWIGDVEPLTRLDQAIGQQATRAIGAGRALAKDSVRAKVLVQRGEVITVYSRSQGIQITVLARAKEDSSLGELVEVESMQTRETYFARVSGWQEAEVFAQAPRTAVHAQRNVEALASGTAPHANPPSNAPTNPQASVQSNPQSAPQVETYSVSPSLQQAGMPVDARYPARFPRTQTPEGGAAAVPAPRTATRATFVTSNAPLKAFSSPTRQAAAPSNRASVAEYQTTTVEDRGAVQRANPATPVRIKR
jgi:flagella basal body P-ring formation protein FlgA